MIKFEFKMNLFFFFSLFIKFQIINLNKDRSKCKNTDGSYQCECIDGFYRVEEDCMDIDECKERPCSDFGTCRNTDGSFEW